MGHGGANCPYKLGVEHYDDDEHDESQHQRNRRSRGEPLESSRVFATAHRGARAPNSKPTGRGETFEHETVVEALNHQNGKSMNKDGGRGRGRTLGAHEWFMINHITNLLVGRRENLQNFLLTSPQHSSKSKGSSRHKNCSCEGVQRNCKSNLSMLQCFLSKLCHLR